ncbi:membrane protein insertion efficiency factor YidD [Flavobacterium sp. KACC 22758]|jgi:putative component of membrane protein insertase Oxa1/YidC/SpoIIIJ protein YidD|uniref:membrane protein insertion efficiency factor YidD n=1 Tax=Flavobacterium sp. KACC 22758 TaxID=3025667 RepID=UPI0023665A68|nr:membrane protein insertion efficiency factor YidD [Flavobacterium sp. KACC 22758]WDF58598.1 membrane protein insertion efficiency factor YidD [Flavobacterium sp. KACC 22758]
MKYLILLLIKMYWKTIPPSKRRKCIFRKSCSNYVFETAEKEGFICGLKAFWFRYQNCRTGFQVFKNPIDNNIQMILPSQVIIDREEIAERLI